MLLLSGSSKEMPRRKGSNFAKQGGNREEVRIYKTREISGGKSGGSLFSSVSNASEIGTYEIEICERPSPDKCSLSTRVLPSKISLSSHNSPLFHDQKSSKIVCHPGLSRSKRKGLSVKIPRSNSKNGLMQSCKEFRCRLGEGADLQNDYGLGSFLDYPCLCVSHHPVNDECERRVEFEDKNTSAVVETVDRAQSCPDSDSVSTALSLTREDVDRKSLDSENDCSCSKCDSVTTSCQSTSTENSSGWVSGSSNGNANPSSASSRTKSKNIAKESSGNGRDKSPKKCSSKEENEGKTTLVLEMIREEKEKQSWNKGEESKACNCEFKNYDDRLKKLEKLCLGSGSRGECGKGTGEGEDSCDCATAILHFAEIKLRINALEKLYRNSIEEEEGKKGVKLIAENVDEGTRTAIELAKIKKRVTDLEMKIINSNSTHPSDQSVKKVESLDENGVLGRGGVTEARSKHSHKEIIDLEKEPEFRGEREDSWKYVKDNRTAAYYLEKEKEPWRVITFRDEAMQTASTSFDDCSDESELGVKADSPKNSLASTESRDTMRFSKECHYYLTQNLEEVGRRSCENPWPGGRPHENIEEENAKNLRKGENPIKNWDCWSRNGLGKLYLRQGKRYYNSKPKREYKNFELCTKYPATNLRQIFASNYVEYGEEYEPFSFDKTFESNFLNPKSKESKRTMGNVRLPHQSFHIYRSQQTRHSLVMPGERRRRMKAPPPGGTGRKEACQERPRHCHVHSFPWQEASEIRERKGFYRGIPRESEECDRRDSVLEKVNPWNGVECKKTGRKMKIPPLFQEVYNSTHCNMFRQSSGMSVEVVPLDVEVNKSPFNPWKKLLRKLSHSQSADDKMKWPPFPLTGHNSQNLQNAKKEKAQDKNKGFKLNSVLKRSWIS